MIAKTASGVMVPVISTSQLPQYEMRANALMTDLHKTISAPSSMDAVTRKGVQDIKEGQQVAVSAAERAKSYEGPKGHNVDEWA